MSKAGVKTSEEDVGLLALQGTLRPENIWALQVPLCSLSLQADSVAAASMPQGAPKSIKIEIDSKSTIF